MLFKLIFYGCHMGLIFACLQYVIMYSVIAEDIKIIKNHVQKNNS